MNRILTALLVVAFAAFLLVGCDNDTSNEINEPGDGDGGGTVTEMTCLGCHSSEELLVASLGEESGSKVAVPNKDDG
jgi:uncharacterized protein YcfL